MRSHCLSLSRYALAIKCSWWARADVSYPEQPVGEKARIGNVVHALTDGYVKTGATALNEAQSAKYSPHELAKGYTIFAGPLRGWLDSWKAENVPKHTEARLRFDVESGLVRPVPRRGEDGYSRPGPTEVTGEIDLVKDFGRWGRIEDLKTGSKRYTNEEQLRAYGVIAAEHYGWERVEIAFLYALPTKITLTPYVTMTEDDLDIEAGRLRRTLRLLPESKPNPGEHCYLCDAKRAGACPAWQQPTEQDREAAFAF